MSAPCVPMPCAPDLHPGPDGADGALIRSVWGLFGFVYRCLWSLLCWIGGAGPGLTVGRGRRTGRRWDGGGRGTLLLDLR